MFQGFKSQSTVKMNGLSPAVDSPARFCRPAVKERQPKVLLPLAIINGKYQPATALLGGKGNFHDLHRKIPGTYRVHFPCLLQSRYPKCND